MRIFASSRREFFRAVTLWPILSWLLPLTWVLAGSLVLSFSAFGTFLPHRIREASGNGISGCFVIPACHLAALSTPLLLLLQRRRSWGSAALLVLMLALLIFEATVHRATGALAGYYDYLNLSSQLAFIPNATSQYGRDLLCAAGSISATLAGVLLIQRLLQPRMPDFPNFTRPSLWTLALLMLAGSGFAGTFLVRGHNATRGLVPIYGLPAAWMVHGLDSCFTRPPPSPNLVLTVHKPAHHLVLVIDESVNFEVFNELWTATPQSARTGPPLRMLSYANNSATSNVLLRHACDPRWPERALSGGGLMAKAKAAGYRIIYYDHQKILRRGDNYLGLRERRFIDEHHEADLAAVEADVDCLPSLIKHLAADQPRSFILINKRGSHFNYRNNFHPHQALPGEPDYYTSVRLNTVVFLQRLVDSGVLAHTSLYFTSDHGEDWRAKVPHGTTEPDTTHRVQWEVPALVLQPQGTRWAAKLPAQHWLSHFHLAEAIHNELGCDDPDVPALEEALDPQFELNRQHEALFVFAFETLGRKPDRKILSRDPGRTKRAKTSPEVADSLPPLGNPLHRPLPAGATAIAAGTVE
jgi:hypothetical protein